ncbi:MAG TPA: NADH-quinone oxidoreductase subunit C [Acidobacteriaceae bacterium]|jgi:NADH-quinone oxidoreductase subunit C|nr:NADH-quinone oxidoreductase subunit C [Acidobacteriaceae bacterium]
MMALLPAEDVKGKIEAGVPGASVTVIQNGSPSGQHSLLLHAEHGRAVAEFLRNDPELKMDFCSNVTGVDWLDTDASEKIKVKKMVAGPDGTQTEQEVDEVRKTRTPGYLEAVYHLFSIEKKHGPVILRMRTGNRTDQTHLPSLTPVWRSAEFQEREVFDLYGIVFDEHPDLRRILMWDGFKDYPMRKDYVPPADEVETAEVNP